MSRKAACGKVQAGFITAIGMHDITTEPQAEDVPFMIDSYEEYDYVHERIRHKLEEAVLKKGYQVLQWGEVGFVYLFSTQPYRTPADFGKGKVFTWNADPGADTAWKAAGCHPVVLSSTNLVSPFTT